MNGVENTFSKEVSQQDFEAADKAEQAIQQSKTMMQLDDVSFAVLAFMRTYSRPDTHPGLIFENGKYLLGHLEALTLSMKQIVEKYESLR